MSELQISALQVLGLALVFQLGTPLTGSPCSRASPLPKLKCLLYPVLLVSYNTFLLWYYNQPEPQTLDLANASQKLVLGLWLRRWLNQ